MRDGLSKAVVEQSSVGQAGQWVVQGHCLGSLVESHQFPLGFLEPGDVVAKKAKVPGVRDRCDREGKRPPGDFDLGLARYVFAEDIDKELRRRFSDPTVQRSEESQAGRVGVEDHSVAGHAKYGVWIVRREPARSVDTVLDALSLTNHAPLTVQRPRNHLLKFLDTERLEHVIEGSVAQTVDCHTHVRIAGQHDHGDIRRAGRQLTEDVQTGFARLEMEITQDQINRRPAEGFTRAGHPLRFFDIMSGGFQRQAKERPHVGLIFDNKDGGPSRFVWRVHQNQGLRRRWISARSMNGLRVGLAGCLSSNAGFRPGLTGRMPVLRHRQDACATSSRATSSRGIQRLVFMSASYLSRISWKSFEPSSEFMIESCSTAFFFSSGSVSLR